MYARETRAALLKRTMSFIERIHRARKQGAFRALPKIMLGKALGLSLVYLLSVAIEHCFLR